MSLRLHILQSVRWDQPVTLGQGLVGEVGDHVENSEREAGERETGCWRGKPAHGQTRGEAWFELIAIWCLTITGGETWLELIAIWFLTNWR